MTRDHYRKKAVRAHAAETGRTYLDAATSLRRAGLDDGRGADGGGMVLAEPLRDALAAALETAGWPVVIEHHPQFHTLPVYAGPATIQVGRAAEPTLSSTGDEHPDDPDVFDLTTALTVTVWAPLTVEYSEALGRVTGVDAHQIPATWTPARIVAELDRVVGQARARDLAEAPLDTACGICGDRYAAGGFARPARPQVAVCPCCAFDGDLLDPEPGQLAFDLDRAASTNLAAPAGWAGVQALLCCLGGTGLADWLHEDWHSHGTSYLPSESWSAAGQTWIWLPPADSRPPALAELGCGASLERVLAAVHTAHPDARERFAAYLAELDEQLDDDYDDADEGPRVPEDVFERFWPAAVGYVVALLTQRAERPGQRSPWHVLASLELLDWLAILAPDQDYYQVETVLRGGFSVVRDLLDPAEDDGPDAPA
ncbi:hypothetical protein [Amycolatopsis sp. NPDC004378]